MSNMSLWLDIAMFFIVYKGVRLLKVRIMHLQSLYVLPIFVMAVAFYQAENVKLMLFFLLIAILAGWMFFAQTPLQADKKRGQLRLQGSKITLILGIILVVAKISYLWQLNMLSEVASVRQEFFLTGNFIFGILSGIYLGRALKLTQDFIKAKDHSQFFKKRSES